MKALLNQIENYLKEENYKEPDLAHRVLREMCLDRPDDVKCWLEKRVTKGQSFRTYSSTPVRCYFNHASWIAWVGRLDAEGAWASGKSLCLLPGMDAERANSTLHNAIADGLVVPLCLPGASFDWTDVSFVKGPTR